MSSQNVFDIINLCGDNSGGHCGYCNKTGKEKSAYGITCDKMKPETYLHLMHKGWRRCGTYYYKPSNDTTCCPLYPIRCDTSKFSPSKSQKRVLNRFKDFLMNGKSSEKHPVNASGDNLSGNPSSNPSKCSNIINKENKSKINDIVETSSSIKKIDRSKKSKTIRYNLKLDKLRKQADSKNVSFDSLLSDYNDRRARRLCKNKPKPLSDYFDYSHLKSPKHTLTIKTVRCHPESATFKDATQAEHALYRKYQCAVHHDKPEEVGLSQFKRFLVAGGLIDPAGNQDTIDPSGSTTGGSRLPQGQYHQQYWLDDRQLIAVGVIDLLPMGLSSVYLFYDPSLAPLRLGVFSALWEINFVDQLRQRYHGDEFKHHYMGFYVHDCPKMNYKARFAPSSLACPVTFDWVPIDRCQRVLDRVRFGRFAEAARGGDERLIDIDERVTVVVQGQRFKFGRIRSMVSPSYAVEVATLARLLGAEALRTVQIGL